MILLLSFGALSPPRIRAWVGGSFRACDDPGRPTGVTGCYVVLRERLADGKLALKQALVGRAGHRDGDPRHRASDEADLGRAMVC
jgi:hypothetical protein